MRAASPRQIAESDLDPFVRKMEARQVHGGGISKFHADMNAGRFPKPDAYLSERMPVWLRSTLRKWQADVMAQPKPERYQVGRKSK